MTNKPNAILYLTVDEICRRLKAGETVEIAADAKTLFMVEFEVHNMANKYDIDQINFKPTAEGWILEAVKCVNVARKSATLK